MKRIDKLLIKAAIITKRFPLFMVLRNATLEEIAKEKIQKKQEHPSREVIVINIVPRREKIKERMFHVDT